MVVKMMDQDHARGPSPRRDVRDSCNAHGRLPRRARSKLAWPGRAGHPSRGSPPPLDPSLAPLLLFDCGADGEESSGAAAADDDDATPPRAALPPDRDSLLAGGGSDDTTCAMSTPRPTDPGCVVVVAHHTDPVLCYCRPGGTRWFRHEYVPEQIDGHHDPGRVIGAMGRLTGASGNKLYAHLFTPNITDAVVTLEFSPDLTLTTTRVVNRSYPTGFWELESCGELFMVSFCYTRLSETRISRVQVQKLDWSKKAWVKVAGLGVNRVFFIRWGQFGVSRAADELGLKGNCVYFTVPADKGLYVHDMEQGTTSVHDPGLNMTPWSNSSNTPYFIDGLAFFLHASAALSRVLLRFPLVAIAAYLPRARRHCFPCSMSAAKSEPSPLVAAVVELGSNGGGTNIDQGTNGEDGDLRRSIDLEAQSNDLHNGRPRSRGNHDRIELGWQGKLGRSSEHEHEHGKLGWREELEKVTGYAAVDEESHRGKKENRWLADVHAALHPTALARNAITYPESQGEQTNNSQLISRIQIDLLVPKEYNQSYTRKKKPTAGTPMFVDHDDSETQGLDHMHGEPYLGWSSLPADLLRTILALLPWSSHPRFAATCRHWRSTVSPFYPAWLTPVLLNAVDVGTTCVRYYSPYYHKNFEVHRTLQTPDAKLCCAKGRHLTLCQHVGTEFTVVDADLVTGVIYDLYPVDCICFDFVIYDGSNRVFGIEVMGALYIARAIKSHNGGWYRWEFSESVYTGEPMLKVLPMSNPVLHRGLLYLLGVDGRLAVYDVSRHEEGFKVLDMPNGFGGFECDDYYLFESDEGELMAVLMGHRGPPVHVVKLNEQTMEWEKVESLEGRALFTGTLVKAKVRWMQNKIFTPRLYDWPETIRVDLIDKEGELAFERCQAPEYRLDKDLRAPIPCSCC
nr:unnamed protein product [Digitaria exilis]